MVRTRSGREPPAPAAAAAAPGPATSAAAAAAPAALTAAPAAAPATAPTTAPTAPGAAPKRKRNLRNYYAFEHDQPKSPLQALEDPPRKPRQVQPRPTIAALQARIVELEEELAGANRKVVDLETALSAAFPPAPPTRSPHPPPPPPPPPPAAPAAEDPVPTTPATPQANAGFIARVTSAATSLSNFLSAGTPTPVTLTTGDRPREVIDTPTRGRPRVGAAKRKVPHNKAKINATNKITAAVAKSVAPKERVAATSWAEQTCRKLGREELHRVLGMINNGVKLSEDCPIPSRLPWKQGGGFGAIDDFFDSDSDDEAKTAPAWFILDERMSEPPAKRQKVAVDGKDIEVIPLNEQAQVDNSNQSASVQEMQPRHATILSPMFAPPNDHALGSNMFVEQKPVSSAQTQTDETILPQPCAEPIYFTDPGSNVDKQAIAHYLVSDAPAKIVLPPAISAPTDFLDVDKVNSFRFGTVGRVHNDFPPASGPTVEMTDAPDLPAWTQPPPPAPTPSHASLPTPSLDPALDPVAKQRAQLLKHTPAKRSGLANVMVPSPSVNSDTSMLSVASNQADDTLVLGPIPSANALDFGSPRLQARVDAIVQHPDFNSICAQMWSQYGQVEIRASSMDDDYDDTPL